MHKICNGRYNKHIRHPIAVTRAWVGGRQRRSWTEIRGALYVFEVTGLYVVGTRSVTKPEKRATHYVAGGDVSVPCPRYPFYLRLGKL